MVWTEIGWRRKRASGMVDGKPHLIPVVRAVVGAVFAAVLRFCDESRPRERASTVRSLDSGEEGSDFGKGQSARVAHGGLEDIQDADACARHQLDRYPICLLPSSVEG